MGRSRNNRTVFYGIFTIILISFIVGILSRVESSFHTGLDLSTPQISYQDEIQWDLPELRWVKSEAKVAWNDLLKSKVGKDYLKAWKTYNNAINTGDFSKMEDFFDEPLIEKIKAQKANIPVGTEQINLSHNITLKHLSKDYAVVVFEDVDVRMISRFPKGEGHFEQTEKVYSLDVKMALQDGNWKIYNWTPIKNNVYKPKSVADRSPLFQESMAKVATMQGVNYYPLESPWFDFWADYDSEIIAQDMTIIKDLGMNSIRIFLNVSDVGRNEINLSTIYKLDDLLCRAAEQGISVLPTLFDFNMGYKLAQYPSYHRQLSYLLSRYNQDESIIAWDIKNEADLDIENHGLEDVIHWCSFMVNEARYLDPNHPVTIGWSGVDAAQYLSESVDFISVHHYADMASLKQFNSQMKAENKLFVIQEFGTSSNSSFWNAFTGGQDDQASEINSVVQFAKAENIPWLVWTLYDYKKAPSNVFGWKPWIKTSQKEFGLIDTSGFLKTSGSQLQSQLK